MCCSWGGGVADGRHAGRGGAGGDGEFQGQASRAQGRGERARRVNPAKEHPKVGQDHSQQVPPHPSSTPTRARGTHRRTLAARLLRVEAWPPPGQLGCPPHESCRWSPARLIQLAPQHLASLCVPVEVREVGHRRGTHTAVVFWVGRSDGRLRRRHPRLPHSSCPAAGARAQAVAAARAQRQDERQGAWSRASCWLERRGGGCWALCTTTSHRQARKAPGHDAQLAELLRGEEVQEHIFQHAIRYAAQVRRAVCQTRLHSPPSAEFLMLLAFRVVCRQEGGGALSSAAEGGAGVQRDKKTGTAAGARGPGILQRPCCFLLERNNTKGGGSPGGSGFGGSALGGSEAQKTQAQASGQSTLPFGALSPILNSPKACTSPSLPCRPFAPLQPIHILCPQQPACIEVTCPCCHSPLPACCFTRDVQHTLTLTRPNSSC